MGLGRFEVRRVEARGDDLRFVAFRYSDRSYTDTWVRVRVRRDSCCPVCWWPVLKGSEAFRPLGDGLHRMLRVHLECLA